MRGDPDNVCWLFNLAQSLEGIGDLKRKAGDDKGACATYEELLMIDRELVKLEDSNTDWLWNLSLSLERIGDVKLNLQDLDAAGEAYDESISILHHFVASDPSKLGWQSRVLVALEKISDLKRVAATTPPPDRERLSITQLLREGDKLVRSCGGSYLATSPE